jgi:hypothetical protein
MSWVIHCPCIVTICILMFTGQPYTGVCPKMYLKIHIALRFPVACIWHFQNAESLIIIILLLSTFAPMAGKADSAARSLR